MVRQDAAAKLVLSALKMVSFLLVHLLEVAAFWERSTCIHLRLYIVLLHFSGIHIHILSHAHQSIYRCLLVAISLIFAENFWPHCCQSASSKSQNRDAPQRWSCGHSRNIKKVNDDEMMVTKRLTHLNPGVWMDHCWLMMADDGDKWQIMIDNDLVHRV